MSTAADPIIVDDDGHHQQQHEDQFQTRLQHCADQIKSKQNVDEARTQAASIAKEALDIEKHGNPDEAIRILALGTEIFNRDPPVRAIMYNNLACVEKRCGRAEDALFHLEAAVECEGGEDLAPPSTLLNLSAAVLSLGYYAASVRVAQQAMRRILADTKPARDAVVNEIKREEAKQKRNEKEERNRLQQQELKARDAEKDKEENEEVKKKLAEKKFTNDQDELQQAKPLWTLKEIEKLEEYFRLVIVYRQDQDRSDEVESLFTQEENQVKEDIELEKKRPPLSPYLGLSGPQLLMLATAKHNHGISLREMGDIVKARHELEFAQDVFVSDDNLGKFPENHPQIERLKSSIDAALSLPYHEGGTTPARAGRVHHNKNNNNNTSLVPYNNNNRSAADGSSSINESSIHQHNQSNLTPSTKSKSKFSKLRGFSSTPPPTSTTTTNSKKPTWDNTTTFGSSVGTPGAGAAQFYSKKSAMKNSHHGGSAGGGQLVVTANANANINNVVIDDPSIETKLAGTYVPLRLVRLTEEVRFRESCRRIALARARLEDLRDFKLLMKRERIFAEEEEERVDLEVEQERLLGVTGYWIQFRILLIEKTTALAEQVMIERSKIVEEYETETKAEIAFVAQELRFLCVQDTERFTLQRQEQDGMAVIARQYAERNAYFEAKAKLNRAQLQALACALSCWAIDNAMRGENTVLMLRSEMQQSPIVLLRSLTFGQGKWATGR